MVLFCGGAVKSADRPGAVDPTFNASVWTAGTVSALVPQSDGKILIGGRFSMMNGVSRDAICRINPDGVVDASFVPPAMVANSLNGLSVLSLALQGDGKVMITGSFAEIAGRQQSGVARLNKDGSFDPSFNPGAGLRSRYAGPAGYGVVVQADGKVLVAGNFDTVDGSPAGGIVRFNTDGSVDGGFNTGTGITGTPHALILQSDGRILVSGYITRVNEVPCAGISRLTTSGAVDDTFVPPLGLLAFGIIPMALQPDGKILIGFKAGASDGILKAGITRLNSNGKVDNSFRCDFSPYGLLSLSLQQSGKFIVAGQFGFRRFNADGKADSTLNPGNVHFTGTGAVAINPILEFADGSLLVGGSFLSINDEPRAGLAKLSLPSVVESDFGGKDSSTLRGVLRSGSVQFIQEQTDRKILIGGDFVQVNDTPTRGIARLNPDGSVDSTFGIVDNQRVVVTASAADAKDRTVIAVTRDESVQISRLVPAGSLDPTFQQTTFPSDTSFLTGIAAGVMERSLAVQPDGRIIYMGCFSNPSDPQPCGIIRFNADGSRDTSFRTDFYYGGNSLLVYPRSDVRVQSDGKILLAAGFTKVNGEDRRWLARLKLDGSTDLDFKPSIDGQVCAIAVQSDGRIIIGGVFHTVNDAKRNNLARLNPDGTLDTTFDPGAGPGGVLIPQVSTLALDVQNHLVIGGVFKTYGGISRDGVARIQDDGTLDLSWDPGTGLDHISTEDAGVAAGVVEIQRDGNLLIGGHFQAFSGVSRNGIVRVVGNSALPVVTILNPQFRNHEFTISVMTETSHQYFLEAKEALQSRNWAAVRSIKGDGSLREIVDSSATPAKKFYRVRME